MGGGFPGGEDFEVAFVDAAEDGVEGLDGSLAAAEGGGDGGGGGPKLIALERMKRNAEARRSQRNSLR